MFLPALIVILVFSTMLYLRFNKGKIAEKMVHHKLMQLRGISRHRRCTLYEYMVGQHKSTISLYHLMPFLLLKPKATKVGFLEEKI